MSTAPTKTPNTKTSYTSGHFELEIDGHKSTAYLKSCEGGWMRAAVIDEPVGGDAYRIKHMATVDVEPIKIEFGLAGANDMLSWIKGSWARKFSRRDGQITHADFNLNGTYSHEFHQALVVETTFPTLDGSSHEGGYLTCQLQPEWCVTKVLPGTQKISGPEPMQQKMWTTSAFRLLIDGLDDMQYTNKLDGFTIKQGIKKMYVGEQRFPQIEPTKIEFPPLTGTISLAYAGQVLQWYNDYIQTGKRDDQSQRSGAIEFLAPNRKDVLFRINLYEVGIAFAGIEKSTANSDGIKRCKFELYVHHMELDGSGGLGFG
jgi:hypothetical protein